MATELRPRRCEWRLRAGQRCAEPGNTYDDVWERWLCPQHSEENTAKLWAVGSSHTSDSAYQPA